MENKDLREKQKQEAIKRLELLQKEYLVHKNVLKEFKEDGTIYYSESFGGFYSGILYWLNNREDFLNIVNEIEKKKDIFIYHCILNHYKDNRDVLTMLYISADEENWGFEKNQLINDGFIDVCICNLDCKSFFDFRNAEIIGVNGGLDTVY